MAELDEVGHKKETGEDLTVYEFPKNSRETVKVRLTTYAGHELIDVRAFYKDGDGFKPGKGLTIRRDLLPELKRAIAAAEKAMKEDSIEKCVGPLGECRG